MDPFGWWLSGWSFRTAVTIVALWVAFWVAVETIAKIRWRRRDRTFKGSEKPCP